MDSNSAAPCDSLGPATISVAKNRPPPEHAAAGTPIASCEAAMVRARLKQLDESPFVFDFFTSHNRVMDIPLL
jgi:hypothetical protein